MKVLVIKMSSLGDVVHSLPAVSDACASLDGVTLDWVVEKSFADIPALHPGVSRVYPVEFRRMRRNPLGIVRELMRVRTRARPEAYDLIIDAQGLIKSSLVGRAIGAPVAGLDEDSVRERLAAKTYAFSYPVDRGRHAIDRVRALFSAALGYQLPATAPDFAINGNAIKDRAVLLLHGTTWPSKHWPETYWGELADLIRGDGYRLLIPAGNEAEFARAKRLAAEGDEVIYGLSLSELVGCISGCAGSVCVDTGLGHLAAALGISQVALYGSTDPVLTGPIGRMQVVFADRELSCAPCLSRTCQLDDDKAGVYPPCYRPLTPVSVWQQLRIMMDESG